MTDLRGRNLLKETDLTKEEFLYLVDLAARLREEKRAKREHQRLAGLNIALIFEKASTRTMCAFEVGAYDQGAHVTYLGPSGSHIGGKESVKDTARVLGRMFDGSSTEDPRKPMSRSWASTPVCRSGTGLPTSGIPPRCWPTSSPCATTPTGRSRRWRTAT